MGASAKRNNYHKANSYQQRVAEDDEIDEAIQQWNDRLQKMEVVQRERALATLIKDAYNDNHAKEVCQALIKSGRWFPEFYKAAGVSPAQVTDQPHYQKETVSDTKRLREERIARRK